MARKNVFLTDPDATAPAEIAQDTITQSRPLAGLKRAAKPAGAIGALSNSLGGMSEKAHRVEELEEQLRAGQTIVELDPALIDSSFVVDRLGVSSEDEESLVAQIREQGQQVPILVRPHKDNSGRYQVAYGHRRLAAIKQVGGKVRAVVRQLSDEELVISQGQENNARTDLSFIERSYFGYRLEKRGFGRDVIMAALGVDKAALSRMISLVDKLPDVVIEAIGPAPAFGRTRWAELGELLQSSSKVSNALKKCEEEDFANLSSDERFTTIYDLLKQIKPKDRKAVWSIPDGNKAVKISENDKRINLVFDKSKDEGFGRFIETKLDELYSTYLEACKQEGKGSAND